MNRRRIAIGVTSVSGLAVVAAGAMGAFGAGSGSANAVDLHAAPAAAVTGAVTATGLSGTAQVDTVVTVLSPPLAAHGKAPATPAQSLTMHGSGSYDFGKQVGEVDLTVPTGSTLDEVLAPDTLYVRRGAAPATAKSAATPAAAWQSTPTAKISDGDVISGGTTGPSLMLAMLGGAQPGVREVGQDVVRGVPVARYQGTLDLVSAAGSQAAQEAGAKQALTNAARAFTSTKVPFDLYLDGQGRIRRFVATVSFVANPTTKQVDQATTAIELYGFGTPVTVTVPKVAAASGAAGALPGGQSTAEHRSAHPTSPTRSHK